MFERPHSSALTITIVFEGEPIGARPGESVAAALIAAGRFATRTTAVSHSARGPFCMMGVCFDCLMVVDGVPSRQACLVTVRDGMRIERQHGARPLEATIEDDA